MARLATSTGLARFSPSLVVSGATWSVAFRFGRRAKTSFVVRRVQLFWCLRKAQFVRKRRKLQLNECSFAKLKVSSFHVAIAFCYNDATSLRCSSREPLCSARNFVLAIAQKVKFHLFLSPASHSLKACLFWSLISASCARK